MDEPNQVYTGLSQAAWGYFLVHFNFNLNFGGLSINILPAFAGFLLLLSAIGALSTRRRDLLLLRPLCTLLAVWHGAEWALAIVGFDLDGARFLPLSLIATAASLYFHFQFLTDMAALAEEYQSENDSLAGRIRRHRTVYTLLVTAIALTQSLSQALPREWWTWIAVLAAVIACIAALMIMADLFRLRRDVQDMTADTHSE